MDLLEKLVKLDEFLVRFRERLFWILLDLRVKVVRVDWLLVEKTWSSASGCHVCLFVRP